MEQATLIKIARLRTLSARHGKPFDVVRFATDAVFARDTLQQVLDTDQEDLLVLGLDVMNALGMVKVDATVQPRPAATACAGRGRCRGWCPSGAAAAVRRPPALAPPAFSRTRGCSG
jgi:hypothetical protein